MSDAAGPRSSRARVAQAVASPFLPLAIGLVMLVALLAALTYFSYQRRLAYESVRHTMEVRAQIWEAFSALQDMETAQRGYLIANDRTYLAPWDAGERRLVLSLEQVARATADNDEQQARLASLRRAITAKIAEMRVVIETVRRGDRSGAANLVREDGGRQLMDQARVIVAQMLEAEARLLSSRLAAVERANTAMQLITFVTIAGVVLLALFTIGAANRVWRDLAASRDAAQAALARLMREAEQREAAETQVRQLQKMEAIGQLTGGIAHDFNNVLAIITSSIQLLQRKLARGEQDVGQLARAALDAAGRAATLTSRLLAFSRQQPLEPQSLQINKLVAGMSEMLRRTLGENVEVETVLAGGLWLARVDPNQLENALLNLCVNARDAMPNGGKLTIETGNAYLDDAYAAGHAEVEPGQYVMVAVSDTGAGMTPEVIARAFEPFFTTKQIGKGTGLGLSQVYGFLKQSGGHVKIYSEPGQGTTIRLYVPRSMAEETEAPAQAADVQRGGAGELVLVVEDDEHVRTMSVAAFRDLGYTVLHAANGEKALQVLAEHPVVTLLFTDIVMPGMNGRQLAEEARKRDPNLKVLYTTGYTQNAVVHNGVLDAGAHLIMKPYTLDQLALKVRDVLDRT